MSVPIRTIVHGFALASPVTVPGVPSAVEQGPAVDVEVEHVRRLPDPPDHGEVVAEVRDDQARRSYVVVRGGDRWVVHLRGAAHCTLRTGSWPVRLRIESVVSDDLLQVLLAGPVMTAVALAHGHHALHASAVEPVPGRAWAFLAPPGGGKSTVAALLASRERPLLSDDALVVGIDEGGAYALPGTVSSRMREGSPLGVPGPGRTADGRSPSTAPGTGTAGPRRLSRALAVVLDQSARASTLNELTGVDALRPLLGAIPLDGARGSLVERHFGQCVTLARHVAVAELRVAWRGNRTDVTALAHELTELLAQEDIGAR